MKATSGALRHLIAQTKDLGGIRLAVVDAAQAVVIETLQEAYKLGLVEPLLIGSPSVISSTCSDVGWTVPDDWIVQSESDSESAEIAVNLVREGRADAIMKGQVHTDTLMRVLLDKQTGLRVPGNRVSHVFVAETSQYPKLLGITDAAINIAPDLNAKAQIIENAVQLFQALGIETPKVAALSAVETINPEIVSTVDAACLTLMAKRGQLRGAIVDGPLAFDNAISHKAAKEKGISSPVAGDADILLVPDLVSGNVLAKNLEYLTGATVAGVALGLRVPVALTSRADPVEARLASLAIAAMLHHQVSKGAVQHQATESTVRCVPQPEHACCPLGN